MSSAGVGIAGDLREWGAPTPAGFSPFEWLWLALVAGVPGAILVLAGGLVAGAAAALIVGLSYAGLLWWWLSRQSRAALRTVQAVEIGDPADAPRLSNLAAGIAADLGLPSPRVLLTEETGKNALACWAGGPVIVAAKEMLEDYTRTELEAVVAHGLIRLKGADRKRAVLASAFGRAAGPAGVVRHGDDDLRTAAFTRYPVGLASAVAKATPKRGRSAVFWFVPEATGSLSQSARVARLNDL